MIWLSSYTHITQADSWSWQGSVDSVWWILIFTWSALSEGFVETIVEVISRICVVLLKRSESYQSVFSLFSFTFAGSKVCKLWSVHIVIAANVHARQLVQPSFNASPRLIPILMQELFWCGNLASGIAQRTKSSGGSALSLTRLQLSRTNPVSVRHSTCQFF